MGKVFDKTLYDECNTKGINAVMTLLKHFNYELISSKEAYKHHDIIVAKDGKEVLIEVELSPSWKSDHFPATWKMTCPDRKKHSKADLYIRTNANTSTFIVVPMKTVHSSPLITKNTIYTTNESFFDCPIGECDIFHLSNVSGTTNRFL